MRKSAFLLIGVLGLFMFLGVVLVQSLMIVQRVARVSEIAGPVLVKKSEDPDFRPLQAETQVLAGTLIRTGSDGEVTLNWVDGTRLRMAPDSELRVRKCSLNRNNHISTALFDLDAGRIWIRVLELVGERSKFEIRTPTATAGVRGTIFSVEVGEAGSMNVEVYEGAVEVSGAGNSLTATAGEGATVTATSATATQLSENDEAEWAALAGISGPRLDLDATGPITVPAGAISAVISGVAEPGATVTVADDEVELDRGNRFSHEIVVPSDAADFDVVIVAEDTRAGKTIVIQQVTRGD